MNKFNEEQNYLEYSLECIDKEILLSKEEIQQLIKDNASLTFEDTKRGEHFNINSMMAFYQKKIRILQDMISSPYFGRIDFQTENDIKPLKIYIGKNSVFSNGDVIITDWRAPICSLYYDSQVGEAEYETESKKVKGNLELKRQINIKNSEIIDVLDSNLATNDELLKPYLSTNADNKMKTIIESIQKEQNEIIRRPITDNVIVQGVAGSGKTSVALHRIAYLIYNLGSKINSNQFLVLGPNDYFLNYVSSILPELETEPVEQKTFITLANEYLEEKLILDNTIYKKENEQIFHNIMSYKSSLNFKNDLDQFLKNYLSNGLVLNGFEIDGEIVYTKEQILNSLFAISNEYPDFESACRHFVYKFKEDVDSIYTELNKKYKDEYINLPLDNPRRKELVSKSVELNKLVREKGVKLLKDYFKKIKTKPLDLYKIFIASLSNFDNSLTNEELLLLQKNTLLGLKKKKVTFEDLPAIMHINYVLSGKKLDYKHIVIDEAQDYGLFHFDIIKEISKNSTFSIYGDLAQSIYSYRSIDSWEDVNKFIFDNSCELLNLRKSYRTTIEITNNANKVLEYMNLNLANPVIRHGNDVNFLGVSNNNNYKFEKIKEWINKGYKTIAVICKTENEAKKAYDELIKQNIDAKYISSKDNEYKGGIFVLTSSSAKGLEFDAVIINDASNKVYLEDSDVDMHLLYVACTRSLHEQVILYNKELTKAFNNSYLKDKEKVKIYK